MFIPEDEKVLLDPTVGPVVGETRLSPRLDSLDGKTVGVIWNGRPEGSYILDATLDNLRQRYNIKRVVFRMKPYLGNIAPEEILDEMAENCDAVVTGVGD